MGNDVKSIERIDGKDMYWDGQCIQGMDAMWSQYSLAEIEDAAAQYQARYDADPIDHNWELENQKLNEIERFQLRLKQCFYMDRAHQLRTYAEHRKAQQA